MSDTDPHEAVKRYFIIKDGGIGGTTNLSGISSHGNEDRVPMWLMRFTVVGGTIGETSKDSRDAISRRFAALLAEEDCERYCEVAALKRIICKREQTDDSVWVEARLKARAEARKQGRECREIEREPAYREGMEYITEVLPDRLRNLLDEDH